jgi:broad specificity phosphatase PhoE
MTSRLLPALLLLLLPLQAVLAAPPAATTVVLVRHAEKALDQGNDPHLTDVGVARAKALAAALESAPVDAIFTTNWLRTKETAAPLASARKIEVQQLPDAPADTNAYATALAKVIATRYAGKGVVVVGHSNTIPAIVEALSGRKMAAIGDSEYDHLYIVTLAPGAAPSVIVAQYGH